MNIQSLYQAASRFFSLAQATTSAQPADIEAAIRSAGLWDQTSVVGTLLNTAGVPDDASVSISMRVAPTLDFVYPTVLTPENPHNKVVANKLASLLKAKYGMAHKNALVKAKLNVASPLDLKWMTF